MRYIKVKPMTQIKTPIPRFYLMTDAARLPNWREILPIMPAGCGVVLRDYNAPNRADLAAEMTVLCRRHALQLFIGADARLARKHKVGLHMPEGLATPRLANQRPHGQGLTMAAHGIIGLRRAQTLKVDAAFVSPIFATNSHASAYPITPIGLAQLMCQTKLPIIALGGMSMQRFQRLSARHPHGFAAITFWGATVKTT